MARDPSVPPPTRGGVTPPHRTAPARPPRLPALAHALGRAPALHRPALVQVRGHADGVDLLVDPISTPDPVEALIGLVAPPEVLAVGLRAPARSRPLARQAPAVDGVAVHLVDRTGASVTVAPGVDHIIGPIHEPVAGRAADACRRILGLPTAPAPPATLATVVHLWLARVARRAMNEPRLDWAGALDLLPGGPTATTTPTTPAETAAALGRAASAWSWEHLRRAVAGGASGAAAGCVGVEAAAWMDAPMLARWVDAELPAVSLVHDVIEATLAPATVDRIGAAARVCATSGRR